MEYDIYASNRVFLELFEAAPHPMWVFDAKTLKFLAANDVAIAGYGYKREEFLKMSVDSLHLPEDAERYRTHLRTRTGTVDRAGRWRHRTRDGSVLHVDIISNRILFDGHAAELMMAIDVSEQVRELEKLRTAEAMYRSLIEHTMVGLYIVRGMKIAYVNPRIAAMFGYPEENLVGMDLLELIVPSERDAAQATIRELVDSPAASSHRTFTGLRRDGSRIIIDVQNTRAGAPGEPIMMGVAIDVTEKHLAGQRAQEHLAHIRRMLDDTLHAISNIGEVRDAYTAWHESRVGNLAAAIGAELGLDTQTQEMLRTVGIVHDTGKIGVPLDILTKPVRLKPSEYDLIKTHAQTGYDILKAIDFQQPVAQAVLQHHERLDGSGYPNGLKGDEILPAARIVAVADVFESMCAHRPYRAALGADAALDEIIRNAGRLYDADASAACARLIREKDYVIR